MLLAQSPWSTRVQTAVLLSRARLPTSATTAAMPPHGNDPHSPEYKTGHHPVNALVAWSPRLDLHETLRLTRAARRYLRFRGVEPVLRIELRSSAWKAVAATTELHGQVCLVCV